MFPMQCDANDEEEDFEPLYNNGHWEWSDSANELVFISHEIPGEDNALENLAPATLKHVPVVFRDDIDVIEQERFKKRLQRKDTGPQDVVFLQDVKDLALFTAPLSLMNINIIKILHFASTERFIRALILYCQYFLQISDVMSHRLLEAETKVRTLKSIEVEDEFRENLEDLRLLVAKEYCSLLLGAKEYKNLHHMGPKQKLRSLSRKEASIFEALLMFSIQIVWLALGRRALSQIETEVHRIFKSKQFNMIEHRHKTNYISKLSPEEKHVLMGKCLQNKTKLLTKSPLMNEATCHRPMDFRLVGLGDVKFDLLTPRQKHLEHLLTESEATFKTKGLTLGILGMLRSRFDIMLTEIKTDVDASSTFGSSRSRSLSRSSTARKSTVTAAAEAYTNKIYDDIVLPEKTLERQWLPQLFPTGTPPNIAINKTQRNKWIARQMFINTKQCPR